ncbi:hypothetical protein C8Q78DRAFT_35108 [Trametes maxima]|nr:hypothetical protein C8Q78DRAFT_35108 [Trametes maxima]
MIYGGEMAPSLPYVVLSLALVRKAECGLAVSGRRHLLYHFPFLFDRLSLLNSPTSFEPLHFLLLSPFLVMSSQGLVGTMM